MARRPRYQKLGIGLDAPARTDFAGLQETARAAQNISRQIDRMSDFVFKQESKKAEQRGKQRVQDLGAQPVLAELTKQGGPTNIEQRAAFATANRIAAAELETEAQLEIDKVLTDAEINKTSFSIVQESLTNITNGLPAALSDLDPETAGILRQRIGALQQKAENKYSVFANNVQVKAAQGRALTGIDVRRRGIMQTAASRYYDEGGNVDEVQRQAAVNFDLENLATFMRDLQFDEDDISKVVLSAKEDSVMESTYFDFRQLGSLEEKQSFISEQRDSLPKIIGEEKARTTLNGLQTEMNKQVTGLKGQATQAKSKVKELSSVLTDGGMPNESDIIRLEQQIDSLGDYGTEAKQDLADFKFLRTSMKAVRSMNPAMLQQEINKLQQGLPGLGGPGLDTIQETTLLKSANKFLTKMNTELERDPFSFGVTTGLITFEPLDPFDADNFAVQAQARIRDGLAVSQYYGTPPAFITDEEAKVYTEIMQGQDVGRQMALLTTIHSTFGKEHAADVFAQIAGKDQEIGHIAGLLTMGMHQVSTEALEGRDLLQQGYVPVDFTPESTKSISDEFFGNAMVVQGAARESGLKVAEAIYAKRANRQSIKQFNNNLWLESLESAFGKNRGLGGIQKVFGDKTLLPAYVSSDEVEAAFDNMTPDKLFEASGIRLPKEQFEEIFKPQTSGLFGTDAAEFNDDYSLLNIGYGEYMIVLGQPNGYGGKVAGAYEDEFGGVEGERDLIINLNTLLNR
jgi:hypothetical protein